MSVTSEFQRILDMALTALAGQPYPLNDVTIPELEAIAERLDRVLETGWVGPCYTVWLEGTEPE